MWDCDDLMMVLFDYYASLNSDGRISSLTFNEWGIFVDHFGLGDPHSPYCKKADLDRIFIAVDTKASHVAMAAAEAAAKKGLKLDSDADEKKALRRTEFFTALVHIAIAKYVRSGEVDSVAKGLHTLMVDVIDPRNRLARTWRCIHSSFCVPHKRVPSRICCSCLLLHHRGQLQLASRPEPIPALLLRRRSQRRAVGARRVSTRAACRAERV
jgi:hypothetical protein